MRTVKAGGMHTRRQGLRCSYSIGFLYRHTLVLPVCACALAAAGFAVIQARLFARCNWFCPHMCGAVTLVSMCWLPTPRSEGHSAFIVTQALAVGTSPACTACKTVG